MHTSILLGFREGTGGRKRNKRKRKEQEVEETSFNARLYHHLISAGFTKWQTALKV
jgi:hypothetical protein